MDPWPNTHCLQWRWSLTSRVAGSPVFRFRCSSSFQSWMRIIKLWIIHTPLDPLDKLKRGNSFVCDHPKTPESVWDNDDDEPNGWKKSRLQTLIRLKWGFKWLPTNEAMMKPLIIHPWWWTNGFERLESLPIRAATPGFRDLYSQEDLRQRRLGALGPAGELHMIPVALP